MMKFTVFTFTLVLISYNLTGQSLTGKWKTIDDETGKEKSIIEIYEKNGKFFGKIYELLLPEDKGKKCEKCKGEDKNKALQGLTFLKEMKKEGQEYSGGTIMDPENGKTYKCSISFKDANTLNVRGFLGISLLGRNQTWVRVK
jgi:uncharacterized protein (DUF2147 family)